MTDVLALDLPDGVYEDVPGWSGMIRHPDVIAMTAGMYPAKPPSTWFENPALPGLTPLTIEDDGRVYGHIAAWHTSHIGMAGGVKPPRSKSNYAYYKTGVVKCDDGKMVNVGQITLTGGHAPLNAGVSKAVAHYDDTNSAIMDVSSGEDRHGIWVAGALRPEVTDAQLRSIRASSVSGDWRPINGRLELVAVCAVNAPGFPIPRARVASGAPIALVAAGIEPLIELAMRDRIDASVEQGIAAGLELFRERVLRLENVVLASSDEEDRPGVDPEQLRRRVRGGSALAAALRERVRGPQPSPEVAADVESLAASLRERVKGRDASPKVRAPEEALTAARTAIWDPLLHPRGADGRFISVGTWVRWLGHSAGSVARGHVTNIVPRKDLIPGYDPNPPHPVEAVAQVEFPDGDGGSVVHDIPFDELVRVASPKGSLVEEPPEGVEPVFDKLGKQLNPTDAQLKLEEISGLREAVHGSDVVDANADANSREGDGSSKRPDSLKMTSDWAEAIRETRLQYEAWREQQLNKNKDADVSLGAYFDWLEEVGLKASIVAALRADSRVRGRDAILARATEYWTEEKRKEAASKGVALPDGQYPIEDKEDLKKAISAYGRAKNKVAVKRHIMRRASVLDETDMIPDGWAGRRGFDPAKHLRGKDGRFAPKGKSRQASASETSSGSGRTNIEALRERIHGTR